VSRELLLILILTIGLFCQTFSVAAQNGVRADDEYWIDASNGRRIDVFTQKGGVAPFAACPPFLLGEDVILYANVTYNGWPVQSKDITFQLVEPCGESFFVSGRTNASGIAVASFALPRPCQPQGLIGIWTVTGSVEIREVVVCDVLEFRVSWNLADVNRDLKVDIYDVIAVCAACGSTQSSRGWNPYCDTAQPYGTINIVDVVAVTANYGSAYSAL